MDNQIDKLAREEIKNREIEPRKSVWDQLEVQLDQEQTPKKDGKNHIGIWLSGLIFMIMLGSFAWFTLRDSDELVESKPENIVAPMTKYQSSMQESDEEQVAPTTTPIPESKPIISIKEDFQNTPIEIKGIQTKIPKSQIIENNTKPTSQPVASIEPVVEIPSKIEEQYQDVIVADNTTKPRFDASKLLEEANADLSKNTSKYNIDPESLLKSAEKDSRDQFINKVVKTLAETSTNVYAMVNNRNVKP